MAAEGQTLVPSKSSEQPQPVRDCSSPSANAFSSIYMSICTVSVHTHGQILHIILNVGSYLESLIYLRVWMNENGYSNQKKGWSQSDKINHLSCNCLHFEINLVKPICQEASGNPGIVHRLWILWAITFGVPTAGMPNDPLWDSMALELKSPPGIALWTQHPRNKKSLALLEVIMSQIMVTRAAHSYAYTHTQNHTVYTIIFKDQK